MTIGQTIQKIRKAYGITQKELSDACGIDGSTLRKYESGRLIPKSATIERIARGLGVDPGIIMEGDLTSVRAMIKLFSIFNEYNGVLIDGEKMKEMASQNKIDDSEIYIKFDSLRDLIYSWYREYNQYLDSMNHAEQIDDTELREKYIEYAKNRFEKWMFQYPESEPQRDMLSFHKSVDKLIDSNMSDK